MKFLAIATLYLLVSLSSCSSKKEGIVPNITPPPRPVDKGWKFETTPSWAEEFEYTGLPNAVVWGYDIGGSGWGNNELEYYTSRIENAEVANGVLTITARKESFSGKDYTSARLVSKGTGDFLYGRVEVRAKLPGGRGTWPAIWMLPTDWEYGDWPKSGEIDLMEHVGYDSNVVHFSVHTEAYNHTIGTQKTSQKTIPTAISDFHLYRLDWTPYAIRGYFDNEQVFTFTDEGKGAVAWPFDKRFHLLLNIAVGGNWGGVQGVDDNAFPASMVIDYIRLYKMID